MRWSGGEGCITYPEALPLLKYRSEFSPPFLATRRFFNKGGPLITLSCTYVMLQHLLLSTRVDLYIDIAKSPRYCLRPQFIEDTSNLQYCHKPMDVFWHTYDATSGPARGERHQRGDGFVYCRLVGNRWKQILANNVKYIQISCWTISAC